MQWELLTPKSIIYMDIKIILLHGIREMMEAGVRENQLKKIPGIADVSVSATGNLRIEFERLGYRE